MDLVAIGAGGAADLERVAEADARDWTIATPLLGSFGTLDTDAGARGVVVNLTRSGYLNAYETGAVAVRPRVLAALPPRQRQLGRLPPRRRPARAPVRRRASSATARRSPSGPPATTCSAGGRRLRGPDLGGADRRVEVRRRRRRSPGRRSRSPPARPCRPTPIPAEAERYVAVRAVDEQGNVGRPRWSTTGPAAAPERRAGPCANRDPGTPDAGEPPAATALTGSAAAAGATGRPRRQRLPRSGCAATTASPRLGADEVKGGRGRTLRGGRATT